MEVALSYANAAAAIHVAAQAGSAEDRGTADVQRPWENDTEAWRSDASYASHADARRGQCDRVGSQEVPTSRSSTVRSVRP